MSVSGRVYIYRNLHRNLFSVRAKTDEGTRVIAYCVCAVVSDVRFIVNPSGYKRAVNSGIRNVHAFVTGIITVWSGEDLYGLMPVVTEKQIPKTGSLIHYNPFTGNTFVSEGKAVYKAQSVILSGEGKIYLPAF